jgi:hypothetical protein
MTAEQIYPSPGFNRDSLGQNRGQNSRTRLNQALEATSPYEKPIPHSPEAEDAVIGSLVIDRDAIIKVAPILKPADFFGAERAYVYEVIFDLYQQRAPGDLITLRDELKRRGKLGEGEGQVKPGYLISLVRTTASPVHAPLCAALSPPGHRLLPSGLTKNSKCKPCSTRRRNWYMAWYRTG